MLRHLSDYLLLRACVIVSIEKCVTKAGEAALNYILLIPTASKHKELLCPKDTLKTRYVVMVDGTVGDEVKVSRLVALLLSQPSWEMQASCSPI